MSTTSRRKVRSSNAALEGIVSCVGAYAMLLGIFPSVAHGTIGQVLLGGAALLAGLHIALGPREGKSIGRATLEALMIGAFTFALIYGCMWYFMVYLASQPNTFQFYVATPTQTP